jgi:osmoprotectant transport system permease protein
MSPPVASILASPLGQVSEEFFRERSSDSATCVQDNKPFCFDWAVDNFDRYTTPIVDHLILVVSSVAIGCAIAFGLEILLHRRRWLIPPILGSTGFLYRVPAIAFFFLLLPFTGRGRDTAIIALAAYTLQIIYRNIVTGLENVPEESKDAGRGMGMTERDLFWRVEVPLALPEIVAGIRIATVSTVALATLAVFAGAGGLGDPIYADLTFKTNIVIAGGIAILMAIVFNLLLVLTERRLTPWRRVKTQAA